MELVLDCVMPYIQDSDDLNSVSLVSTRCRDIDSLTRKHLTVHVHYMSDPSRLSRRFPNLESLTLKSYSHGLYAAEKCRIPVTPWIRDIVVKFKSLKSLCIRNMVVSASDLKRLAKTLGGNLTSLEIWGCKLFSEDGLADIARYCIELTSLRLQNNWIENDYTTNGKWLHELALHNTVMESLNFHRPFDTYDMKDVTLLAKKCSNSLVSLNIFPRPLIDFRKAFNHAKKLDHFGIGIINEDSDYSSVKFPSSIRGLHIEELRETSFPFLLPYLCQLRELNIECADLQPNCLCFLIQRCPRLEVLVTQEIGGDDVLQVIGQICKKLRKLTHNGWVTQMGLIALAQECPNLDYLSVYLLDISNEALECVGTHLKNLRDFRIFLAGEDGITDLPLDKGVRDMLMGCRKLEKLDIRLCVGGLTDVGLGYIGEYGHNLRHLSLGYTGESDAGLLELSKGCPKLRKLKLDGCPFSKQAIATSVFINNHSLRYIRVKSDFRDYLVLTRPMVSAEVLTKQYLKLAEKLHRLAVQLVADGSDAGSVKITYTSSRLTDDIDTPLVRSLVASSIRNEEWDTLGWSSEKPLEIIVRVANVKSRFATAVSEFDDIKLQGRVKDGVPHLTKVGAFEVDVSLEGNILLCRQVDQGNSNTISRVTILVEENVNINSMSVGRPAPRKQAVMVIGIDEKPNDEALKKINEIPAVEEFVFLALFRNKIVRSEGENEKSRVFQKWNDGLDLGVLSSDDVDYMKKIMEEKEMKILPTVKNKWVSLHQSFGLICWCDDEELRKEFMNLNGIDFLRFGELTDLEKQMLQTKVSVLFQRLGIPSLSEVVSTYDIPDGLRDGSFKTSLVNWALPFTQRYIYSNHPNEYSRLKLSEFNNINSLKIVVVEKLFYKNVIKRYGIKSNNPWPERYSFKTVIGKLALPFTTHKLSHILLAGIPESYLANFLQLITTMTETGKTEDQMELFIANSQNIQKLPCEESQWSLVSMPSPEQDSKWPPAHWKTAPKFKYASETKAVNTDHTRHDVTEESIESKRRRASLNDGLVEVGRCCS
ncbi:leucine-rich repeat, cysteine-containing subtype protein [Tanacetum coccineum]